MGLHWDARIWWPVQAESRVVLRSQRGQVHMLYTADGLHGSGRL